MGIKRMDFKKLLEPYKDGGTEQHPVERTIDTIAGKLIIANKIPPNIVGAAVFQTFWELSNGLEFKGSEKYGSAGNGLFHYIRNKCVELGQEEAREKVYAYIREVAACTNKHCPKRNRELTKLTRWQRFKKFMLRPRGVWDI